MQMELPPGALFCRQTENHIQPHHTGRFLGYIDAKPPGLITPPHCLSAFPFLPGRFLRLPQSQLQKQKGRCGATLKKPELGIGF